MSARYEEAGARVLEARRALGWRQWELARKAGVASPSYISALENGHEPPAGPRYRAVTEALGLNRARAAAAAPAVTAAPHPPVRWFRDISAACECEWEVTADASGRVTGHRVARAEPWCPVTARGAAA